MTTMKEIAEQTGVSISTVSLVLNGRDEGRVNPTLASPVRNKATELGYKINPLARSLRTNKTRILGFISEEVATTPYAATPILPSNERMMRLKMSSTTPPLISTMNDEMPSAAKLPIRRRSGRVFTGLNVLRPLMK